MLIGEKIKYLREKFSITQEELAQKIGTSKQTIYKYENKIVTNIPSDKIEMLARALQTSPAYLMGWGEETKPIENIYTDKEKKIIKKYRVIDNNMKKVVDNVLDTCYEIATTKDYIAEEDLTVYKEIPCYPKLASAGNGQYIFDDIPFDMIKIDTSKYINANYAIQVNGDSMQPTFNDGDILIVSRNAIPDENEIGIFIVDGMGYVKRRGKDELLSDNPDYPNVKGTEGLCMGKVLGKI